MATNVDILTRSHTALKAKARAKKNQIESIVFDDDARLEFLTGFRKRNLEKKETKKNKAKERERVERLQARKEQRQALKERAKENARQVESVFRGDDYMDDDLEEEEYSGFSSSDKGKGKATQEFEDEEQLATVTIVEEFDPDSLRHIPSTSQAVPEPSPSDSEVPQARISSGSKGSYSGNHSEAPTTKPPAKKPKSQPKRIAYETKAARKATRVKQRARRTEKAELAGGKSSRRRQSNSKGGKGGKKSR